MRLSEALGHAIRARREAFHLSQEHMASHLSWSQARISYYETSRRIMGIEDIEAVARVLGLSASKLVARAEAIQRSAARHASPSSERT